MPSDSKAKAQTTEEEPKIKFVQEKTTLGRVVLGLTVSLYTWFGGAFLLLFLILVYPPISENPAVFYGIWYSLPIVFFLVALGRNRILLRRLKKKGHRDYLDFAYIWGKLVLILTFILVVFYFILGFNDPKFYMLSGFSFFFFIALYMIFNDPLTKEGEIVILFELLSHPITNFHEALKYWKKLAEKIESMLRVGNIQLSNRESNKDLVYYFSKKLLETTDDISNDLLSVREWMLGRQRSCLEAIRHIGNSDNKKSDIQLVPCQKNVFIAWFLKNPDVMTKYVFNGLLIVILIVLSPDLIGGILSYLQG